MAGETDAAALEAAFLKIFAWVQAGKVTSSLGDRPYRWQRGSWEATDIATSPAGAFQCLQGLGAVAYYRPDRHGFGFSRRIDLRTKTTAEMLILAAEDIGRPPMPLAAPGTPAGVGDTTRYPGMRVCEARDDEGLSPATDLLIEATKDVISTIRARDADLLTLAKHIDSLQHRDDWPEPVREIMEAEGL